MMLFFLSASLNHGSRLCQYGCQLNVNQNLKYKFFVSMYMHSPIIDCKYSCVLTYFQRSLKKARKQCIVIYYSYLLKYVN